MRCIRRNSRGFILPAVMLFLAIAFGMWAVLFRSSASILRVEQARVLRADRTMWVAPAMADGLRLLETGTPPTDPFVCKVTLTQESQTRYVRLTFDKVSATRWTLDAVPTDASDASADAPASFATPDAPTGLTALAISSSSIYLTWSDVQNETGYVIDRSPNGNNNWVQAGSVSANVTAFTATGLAANKTYHFRVHATGTFADSGYSATDSAKTQQAGTPNAPTGLTVTVLSATSVRLNWTDNSNNETGFRPQRSTNGNSWTNLSNTSANVTTQTVTGLTTGQLYYFQVRANGSGNSDYSNVVTATPN